jgi:predicted ATP-grasp superfamily ATP-dependent carboligase
MKLFVYEIVSAGGLGAAPPPSLAAEGWAMLAALAADFAAIAELDVHTLLLPTLPAIAGVRCERHGGEDEEGEFARLVERTDAALVIAPEFDGWLERRSRQVLARGRRLFGCSADAIALTGDKLALARHWKNRGVPTPETIEGVGQAFLPARLDVAPGRQECLPHVLKPRHGAGSVATKLITDPAEWQPAWHEAQAEMPGSFIVQPFCPGRAASVALLIGSNHTVALEPAEQLLSHDGRFHYLGGRFPLAKEEADRARHLARRAVEGIAGLAGYVGVDLILGRAADGSEDRAIEINPRPTTSYIGLRRRASVNLATVWLDLLKGASPPQIEWMSGELAFTPHDADSPHRPNFLTNGE